MVEEAVEVAALHLEGEANAWWFSHSSHTRVIYFLEFTQGMIRTFYGEISEERNPTPPWEETSTSTVIALREQPSTPAVGAAITLEGGAFAALQEVPTSHQGMGIFPFFLIAANLSKNGGNMSLYGPR